MQFFEPIFPSGLIAQEKAHTAEELAQYENSHAWDLKINLLKKQKFYSTINVFHTSYIQMALVERSLKNSLHGYVPKNTILFGFIVNEAGVVQQKQLISHEDVFILKNNEIDAFFGEEIKFVTICIHAEMLKKRYSEKYKEECTACKDGKVRRCDSEMFSFIKSDLLNLYSAVMQNPSLILNPQFVHIIETNIINNLLNIINISTPKNKTQKPEEIAHILHEQITEHYQEDISIELLCKKLKISPSNAYLTFNQIYKLTPRQYLIALRLNNINRILKSPTIKTTTIEEVAMSNGFYHMGHFAKTYKNFFTELPSETVLKNNR